MELEKARQGQILLYQNEGEKLEAGVPEAPVNVCPI